MRIILPGIALAVAAIGMASAAELPTMKRVRTEHLKTCTVGGMTGFLIPGSDTCVKLGGYVSGGVEMGNLKSSSHD
ncbi:porin [Methylocapsa sp. S129]|uniref:porin n=1 Tax=Methylocapsa sp. S129 TaxID=1641869 RepID=UPI00131E91C8|nr:porin [Methylocapsa sp. S129]